LRRDQDDEEAELEVLAGRWLGAEAPEEEQAEVWLERASVREVHAPAGYALEPDPFTAPMLQEAADTGEPAAIAEGEPVSLSAWLSRRDDEPAPPEPVSAEMAVNGGEPFHWDTAAGTVEALQTEAAPPRTAATISDPAVADVLERLQETMKMIRSMRAVEPS
jgi:hypothetical protein